MTRSRSIFSHLFLLGLCSWAIHVQLTYRIPGGYVLSLLPLINIAAACLTIVVMILHLMGKAPVAAPFNAIFRYAEQWSRGFIILFCAYNAFVFVNARWDTSVLRTVPSKIIEVGGGEFNLGYPIQYFWTEVRSWKSPTRKTERLLLTLPERENLWVGRSVSLKLHRGYFDVPWISAIVPDKEQELVAIVHAMPTASQPRRNLTYLYLEQHRWDDATRLAAEQMRHYPNDLIFIRYVSGTLLNVERFSDIVTLLEPVARRKRDYQIDAKLGFALAMTGRKPEGLRYLESAINADPRNYWAYYALGYVHVFTGTSEEAVPAFQKVLQIRPHFPEIQDMLGKIQKKGPAK